MFRAIEWISDPVPAVRLIDQTKLPISEEYLDITTVDRLTDAIQRLVVRGAPALGAAGAYGVALAMAQSEQESWEEHELQDAIERIREARPTAVNLAWGVEQVQGKISEGFNAVLEAAKKVAESDEQANRELSRLGADWILEKINKPTLRVITHCNTGALATTAWGTAFGIIRELHERQAIDIVYADETRPLLQGARLTSWELKNLGVNHKVQVDAAAASTILRGLVDVAIIGADRITANGDTVNKIGSVTLALACQRAGIPFVVAAPSSTIDLRTETGDDVFIEERSESEIHFVADIRVTPDAVVGFNPAFDVTPHDLISAIVTEIGVVEPTQTPGADVMAELSTRK